MNFNLSPKQVKELVAAKLSHNLGVSVEEAGTQQFYKGVSLVVRDLLIEERKRFMELKDEQQGKQVYYLCMEFLMGRSLQNNLYNLHLEPVFEAALKDFDIALAKLYDLESDAGLGNGGLGRLAACFLDGLASQGFPAMGYSLRYEYGIFKQKLVDGWQTELPDFWLPSGEVWLDPRPDEQIEIRFDGFVEESWNEGFHHVEHKNYTPVIAIPYDMMVSGNDGKGVSVLRLWRAQSPGLDMTLFNQGDYMRAMEQNAMAEVITKVLYPADNHREGKSLRLTQQYFLVSASIRDIVHRHLAQYSTMDNFADKVAIHINDTHPALAIPELMRILLDECGYSWDDAWDIVTHTMAYTNHTVMAEALECWPEDLFRQRLPRIYQIVVEINHRFYAIHHHLTGGDEEKTGRMSIISNGVVRMANLCVVGSHHVNGVSRLHSDIVKNTIFHDFYSVTPEKFTNVTNGIAHRRWLCQSNPELTQKLTSLIGDGFVTDAAQLEKLLKFKDDEKVLQALEQIKLHNKMRLAQYIKKNNGIDVDPNSIFDIQVKRLHEYKRQHLNALHILAQYQYIKEHPQAPVVPRTYIFGAKAAPGYFLAKQIIRFIVNMGDMVNNDPEIGGKIKVVYLEDYKVTLAQLLMPAADISEQISLASTEASGTGNMKLMMNGALTLGTLDGANVEIHEAVGDENIFLFGLTTPEVNDFKHRGYRPQEYYNNNAVLRRAVDAMRQGFGGVSFSDLADSLINSDPYMVMADFQSYCQAQDVVEKTFLDREKWNRMSLVNIAKSGIFAADRSIRDYARNIWNLTPIE